MVNIAWYANAIGIASEEVELTYLLVSAMIECMLKDSCFLKCEEIKWSLYICCFGLSYVLFFLQSIYDCSLDFGCVVHCSLLLLFI